MKAKLLLSISLFQILLCVVPIATASPASLPSHFHFLPVDNEEISYPLTNFSSSVISSMSPQGNAVICSLQLRKYRSWINWRHEFIILSILYQERDYFVHMNRAWDSDGSWLSDYVPQLTWGSVKPAEQKVSIYLPGKKEDQERVDTELVAQISFHGPVTLRNITVFLASMDGHLRSYELLGMNCWTWSRYVTMDITDIWRNFVHKVELPRQGLVDIPTFLTELLSSPWVGFGQSVFAGSE